MQKNKFFIKKKMINCKNKMNVQKFVFLFNYLENEILI